MAALELSMDGDDPQLHARPSRLSFLASLRHAKANICGFPGLRLSNQDGLQGVKFLFLRAND